MKTSNNSPADNEVTKNDTPNALISDNDLLKFFNLERENVQDFSITHRNPERTDKIAPWRGSSFFALNPDRDRA